MAQAARQGERRKEVKKEKVAAESRAEELAYSRQARQARLATGTGWLLGLAARAAYSVATRRRDAERDEEGGGGTRRGRDGGSRDGG